MNDAIEERGTRRGWLAVIALSVALIGWGLLTYFIVQDRARVWYFGALPDAPSQSVYSTEATPQTMQPPRQTPQLPEAKPWKKPPPGSVNPTSPWEETQP